MPRTQKDAGRTEEQPMEVSVCRSPVPALGFSQDPGTSPEGPTPLGGGEDEDAEEAVDLPEASAPKATLEPEEPRSPQQSAALPRRYMLREREGAPEPASCMKETPDPWQSLDPFDSLESKPFKKGRPYSVPPVWRRLRDRSARGRVLPSCRTSTSGTWLPMLTMLTAGGLGERVRPLQTWRSCTGHT